MHACMHEHMDVARARGTGTGVGTGTGTGAGTGTGMPFYKCIHTMPILAPCHSLASFA